MFPMVSSFKVLAIAVAVSLSAGGVVGARVQKKFDNAAYYAQLAKAKDVRIKALEGQIATRDQAARADTAAAVKDALERKQLEDRGRELETNSNDRVCFDAAASDRLRGLWARPAGPAQGRPAAGAR